MCKRAWELAHRVARRGSHSPWMFTICYDPFSFSCTVKIHHFTALSKISSEISYYMDTLNFDIEFQKVKSDSTSNFYFSAVAGLKTHVLIWHFFAWDPLIWWMTQSICWAQLATPSIARSAHTFVRAQSRLALDLILTTKMTLNFLTEIPTLVRRVLKRNKRRLLTTLALGSEALDSVPS